MDQRDFIDFISTETISLISGEALKSLKTLKILRTLNELTRPLSPDISSGIKLISTITKSKIFQPSLKKDFMDSLATNRIEISITKMIKQEICTILIKSL